MDKSRPVDASEISVLMSTQSFEGHSLSVSTGIQCHGLASSVGGRTEMSCFLEERTQGADKGGRAQASMLLEHHTSESDSVWNMPRRNAQRKDSGDTKTSCGMNEGIQRLHKTHTY